MSVGREERETLREPRAGKGAALAGSALAATSPGEVRFDVDRGVATLTLGRPAARNALTISMIESLHTALDRIERDPKIRLAILRGEGDHFCAGADVKAFFRAVDSGAPEEADHFLAREYALDLRLSRLPIPLVTLADGIAMGGGLGLALGGYIVATRRSRFAMPESRIGFLPDVGATFELPHRLGRPLARYLAWTSESFGGEQAVRWGFADAVIDAGQLEAFVASLTRAARGEAGARMRGSAEIAFLHGRVAGGVPAFQGRWIRGSDRLAGDPELRFVERHFLLATRHDVLRSLEKGANGADDGGERDWCAQTLALLGRRSPISIWAADLLLSLDYESLAAQARQEAGRERDRREEGAGGEAGEWISALRRGLESAEVEAEHLAAGDRPEPRALALGAEFLFASAMFRLEDFLEGVRAFQERREPEFPSAREPLGIHRALFVERMGWTLLRHAARLARDPFWLEVARQELDWMAAPLQGYDGSSFPRAAWFADGTLNASVEAVDRWVEQGRGGRVAFCWEGDRIDSDRRPLEQRSIHYADLLREVQRCAAGLRALGLGRGDTLVLYMPNIIETCVVQLAAARIGVVYHPVFAGFAREELSDRIHLMGASVLVTVDGAFRKGEAIQYKRDFVDPALRDFVPVDRALEAARGVLQAAGADPDGALLGRLLERLTDKVTVEKAKFLELLSIESGAIQAGRAARGGEEAPAAAESLESILLGPPEDATLLDRVDRAARHLDGLEEANGPADQAGIARRLAAALDRVAPPIRKVVVLRQLGSRGEADWVEGRDLSFEDLLSAGESAAASDDPGHAGSAPEAMGAEDPLFVMFTSGSTGKPKGLVHTHGGYLARLPFLLKTLFGLSRDQRILTVADPGWITGQSFACWGPLVYGMTSVLVGFVPVEDRLWAAIERYRVNFLKTGVTGMRASMGDDPEMIRSHDLGSLRHRGGEPVLADLRRTIETSAATLPPGPAGEVGRAGLARLSLCLRAAYLARFAGDPSSWPALFDEAMAVAGTDPAFDLPSGVAEGLRGRVVAAAERAAIDRLRYTSCSCAEPLDAAVQAWWESNIGPMMNCWWRTEDAAPETGASPTAHPQTPNAAARPLPWADLGLFVIHDDEGNRIPPRHASIGEKGTVFVRANPGIARGTWIRPEKPEGGAAPEPAGDWRADGRFREIYHGDVPGWHNTGDAAVANPDGTLGFLGRDDEVLNVSGHRVGTQEIEGAVRSHAAVANVAAIGIPAETRGDNPALFIKLRPGHAPGGLLDNQIREAVSEAKGSHVAPSPDFIFYVPSLPTTKSGKILRRFLKYAAALDRDTLAGILSALRDDGLRRSLIAADRQTLARLFPALERQGRTLRLGSVATVDQMGVLIDVLRAVAGRRDLIVPGADRPATGREASQEGASATDTSLAYEPYAAGADRVYALGRPDFRPGIDPLPTAQEAWAMRRDLFGRPAHGEPMQSLVKLIEPVPRDPEPNEVIVQNLFAGSTHNVLHALLADPVSPFEWHRQPYHVLGSGAVCRVVACGREVDRQGLFAPGQLGVNFPATYRLLDPKVSEDAMHAGFEIQGFETPGGTLRPFDRLQATQLLPVPKGLTLEQAASFMLNLVTVYRALVRKLSVRRGESLLIEGATGGTGAHAVELGRLLGCRVVGIVSSERRGEQAIGHGAAAWLNRTDPAIRDTFTPVPDTPGEWATWEEAGRPLLEMLRARNQGRLLDAVVSFSGRSAFGRLVQALAPGGRLAFFGAFGGYCLRFLGKGPEADLPGAAVQGASRPGTMLRKAGLRPGMGVLIHYGAGAGGEAAAVDAAATGGAAAPPPEGDDDVGLQAIRAAEEAGARVVALTNTDAQSARLNRDPEIARRLAGAISLESLRRGSRFEWPDRMPDSDRDPKRYEHYETYSLKPLATAVGRLLRHPGDLRGQPDVVFARGDEDTLAADLFMVRPHTGVVVYAEPRRRAYTLYAPQVWMRQRRVLFPSFEIIGSHMGNPQQGREVIDWISQGLLTIPPPVVFEADEAPRAFQQMHTNSLSGSFVVHLTSPGRGLRTEREVDEAGGARFFDEKYVTVRIDEIRTAPDGGRGEPLVPARVARVTLRGDGGRPPTLARDAIYQIGDAFGRLAREERLAAVILTGEGSVAFLAGQDLRQLYDDVQDVPAAEAIARDAQRIFDAIEAFPRPVIGVVNGVALGGGHELLTCAHYRVAARSPRVRVAQPEIELGIMPGFGGTQRLTRLLIDRFGLERGVREALEMNLGGRHYEAAEAEALGLIDEMVEANALQRAYTLAFEEIAAPPGGGILARARARRLRARAAWSRPLDLPERFLDQDARLRLLLRQATDPAVGRGVPAVRAIEATLAGLREGFEAGCALEARLFASLVVDERFGRRGIRRFLERREPDPLPAPPTVRLGEGEER
jgi:acyl-coenzyme A synthetase/AMP-(fatty) acid ligase/enoyl-CoA hydratase/carnithine racemase/NADPH:quinone reductase-like Zn-dependent oxidoreductase